MPSKAGVCEETWASFHRKHHSQVQWSSSKRDVSLWQSSFCSSGSCVYDDDDEDKNWLIVILDMLTEPTKQTRSTRTMAFADDDSSSSMDSAGKKRRFLSRKKKGSVRRKGNVKISAFSR